MMSSRALFDAYFTENRRREIAARYRDHPLPPISFGTVRDFCDSADHLGPLASYQGDLKDLQRCWMLKALLSAAPPGARLLEIGAGEPVVAGVLSRLGYDVTIVDPYDGAGNGPVDYERYVAEYPDLRFVRSYLGPTTDLGDQPVDVFYSISVLEHVPEAAFVDLTVGVRRAGRSGARTIHAVDHVLKGRGAEYHEHMLLRVGAHCGVPDDAILAALRDADADIETYLLSAEAHNRWRGGLAYDSFPMRRCVSAHFNGTID